MVNIFESPLTKSVETLKKIRMPHIKYEEAVKKIASGIFVSLPGELVCIVGPSRVGKTTATYEACSQLMPTGVVTDDALMPIVRVRLRNSINGGKFDSLLFIQSALHAIKHPIYGVDEPDDPFGIEFDKSTSRISESRQFRFFTKAIVARKTIYLIIDEVQHLKYAINGKDGATAILDSWKAFAEETGIILILIGTYPILDTMNISPHMLGRTDNIEFPRYRMNPDDIAQFQLILNTLDSVVPFDAGKLSDHNKFLYDGCYGCIGLLLRWIRGSLGHAIALNKAKLSKSDLITHMKRDDDLMSIRSEIDSGEDAISNRRQDPKRETHMSIKDQQHNSFTKPRKKLRPFQSKPRNYKKDSRC